VDLEKAIRSTWREAVHTFRPPRGDRHGPLVPATVALTIVTGVVDATSYLELGHVFVANMTGNVVFLHGAHENAHRHRLRSERGRRRGIQARRSIAVAAMLLGALAGGLLVLHVSVAASLGLAGALVLGIGLAVHVLSRPDAAWI
jgi:uncharacterized membrane protein YoaK (UPF0700 family)